MKINEYDKRLNPCQCLLSLSNEMQALFEVAPPGQLRKSIEFIFFNFLEENEDYQMGDFREMFKQVHGLINFLDRAEGVLKGG